MRLRSLIAGLGVAITLTLCFPVVAAAQVQTVTVCWDNYKLPGGDWDWSDSVPFGTVPRESDFTTAGLVLDLSAGRQTSPSNQGKSSAYVAVTAVPLSSVNNTDALIEYDGTPTPGYQLRAHAQGNDVWNGHLVRENGSDKWWATRPQDWPLVTTAAAMEGGATLADYKAAYPLATVSHVGYSLGSGVTTVGLLKSMTFQGRHWVFGLCSVVTTSTTTTPPVVPPVDTSTSTTTDDTDVTTTTTTVDTATTTTTTADVELTTTTTDDVVLVGAHESSLPDTGLSGEPLKILGGVGLLMVLIGALTFTVVKLRRRA
jgi:hypothetical protein